MATYMTLCTQSKLSHVSHTMACVCKHLCCQFECLCIGMNQFLHRTCIYLLALLRSGCRKPVKWCDRNECPSCMSGHTSTPGMTWMLNHLHTASDCSWAAYMHSRPGQAALIAIGHRRLHIPLAAQPFYCKCHRAPFTSLDQKLVCCCRAILVQLGFFFHMQQALSGSRAMLTWPLLFAISFMLIFSVVIALFKDLPDIEGDSQVAGSTFCITTMQSTRSARHGARQASACIVSHHHHRLCMFDCYTCFLHALQCVHLWLVLKFQKAVSLAEPVTCVRCLRPRRGQQKPILHTHWHTLQVCQASVPTS